MTRLPLDISSLLGKDPHSLHDEVYEFISDIVPIDHYVQRRPNLRIHDGAVSAIPFHSDVLYGHSPAEVNYWLALTPCRDSASLWVVPERHTQRLHDILRSGATLADFDAACRREAEPVQVDNPGLYTFCCSQIHGSIPNVTGKPRISFDIRSIHRDAACNVKRRGSYFGNPPARKRDDLATSVATLDFGVPLYLQRRAIADFHANVDRELVEFHDLRHAPTLEHAISVGPVVAYTIRQLKRPVTIEHSIGFADEQSWFDPGEELRLEKCRKEMNGQLPHLGPIGGISALV